MNNLTLFLNSPDSGSSNPIILVQIKLRNLCPIFLKARFIENRIHMKKERKQIGLLQPFSWKNFGKHTNLQQKQSLV